MQLNQNYVMSDTAYNDTKKKKEVEQIEQLAAELHQRERLIIALKEKAISKEDSDMKEIFKKIHENCTIVEMVNDTRLAKKKLEREIEELKVTREKYARDLVATKQEAQSMLQIHGLSLGIEDTGDGEAAMDPEKKKGTNVFQRKKENLEDRAKIVELEVSERDLTLF